MDPLVKLSEHWPTATPFLFVAVVIGIPHLIMWALMLTQGTHENT